MYKSCRIVILYEVSLITTIALTPLKGLRKRLGFSQEQFADVFAVSSATVKLWEKGGLYPTQQDWQRIMLGEVEGVEALHSNGHMRKMLHCSVLCRLICRV
jgi:DNA-binding transcriptional regulator YiaG